MNIQGFQKLTLLDFPGKTACTVFTGGCNLRCPFWHNGSLVLNPTEQGSVECDVLEYLKKRAGIIDGVCITGGEPLLQPDLLSFVEKCKEIGVSVKLDTNGASPEKLKKILDSGKIDYVAMDIKAAPDNYERAVGVKIDFSVFKESMEIIRKSGVQYEFRTTAVKGIHTISDFEEIAKLLKPDENYFIQKFTDSGNLLNSSGLSSFSADETEIIIEKVKKYIPRVASRG